MILFIIETRNQLSKTYLFSFFISKTTTYFMETSKCIVALIFRTVAKFLRAQKADWALDNDN